MGKLKDILIETKRLTEATSQEQMQYIKAFASAHPEKYKELVDWAGTSVEEQKMLRTYLEAWSSKHYEGNLNFYKMPIEDLGQLQSVSGALHLHLTLVKDLSNLRSVGSKLVLDETPIETLSNLQSVGGHLRLGSTLIKNLGVLRSVGGNLDLLGTPIESLGHLRSVGGSLDLSFTPIEREVKSDESRIRDHIEVGGKVRFSIKL